MMVKRTILLEKKPDPRKLMEQSVAIMAGSVAEPRSDGKASPLVGAVLVKADGTVECASRGELRDGDHAEYTLLERKNRDTKLDGAILFSTLEPCAPGARRHPKLSCAERIVLARIKEVWIGIEDPDPTVDRKGIKYLQDNGVKVHIFDRDLQEIIQTANKDFIAQAEERAAAAREGELSKPVVLSGLESPLASTDLRDLDMKALDDYRRALDTSDKVGSQAFNRRLLQHGLLQELGGTIMPTGFGLLLFGKEPRSRLPQAGLLGTIHFAGGGEEMRDFDGPMVNAPKQAMEWLESKLPTPIDRTQAKRRGVNDALFELVREGIVNALVHRDYGIEGAKCQLFVEPDRISIKSPGLPVDPITLAQLQAFDAPMLSRNPAFHFVFAKLKLAEERGLGLKSMRERARAVGLPLPEYSYMAPYLTLTLFRVATAAVASGREEVFAQLSAAELEGWKWLATQDVVTAATYQSELGIPLRTARFQLNHLTELGLLQMSGAARATKYKVIRS
jgi:ATP-dependent DNA helicase RecG